MKLRSMTRAGTVGWDYLMPNVRELFETLTHMPSYRLRQVDTAFRWLSGSLTQALDPPRRGLYLNSDQSQVTMDHQKN
jgi:hypothetical protein